MSSARLSALDASFLDVESPTAHMHVGWAATFLPPDDGVKPSFEVLRDHIAGRLGRAPRYRQKLSAVPLDVHEPVWIDDADFEPARHIRLATAGDLGEIVDEVMSVPLDRDRPLWQMWIAPDLDDGRVGLVGKAHHCMVDGLAAVELATLLLDPQPEPMTNVEDRREWLPEPAPTELERLAGGYADRMRERFGALVGAGRSLASPRRLMRLPGDALRLTGTLADTVLPIAPPTRLNQDGSALRHLESVRRPLDDLRQIKKRFGVTVNDVVLAASAGALRAYMTEHDDEPVPLKTMVPVSVRTEDDEGQFGNRISFMFVELPCDEPDSVRRLERVHAATAQRKEAREPEQSDAVLNAASYLPRLFQRAMSRAVASPLLFNLVVSNIPGPRETMWMCGLELEESYPIVPLADRHALSIGMTTIKDDACFGLYADRATLPDADRMAWHLDAAIDELYARAGAERAEPLVTV
jgi:diacylglycerol O-acyltransferase / wax synthase